MPPIGLRAMLLAMAQPEFFESVHTCIMLADCWLKVRWNRDTDLFEILHSYPQNKRCQNSILDTNNYAYEW